MCENRSSGPAVSAICPADAPRYWTRRPSSRSVASGANSRLNRLTRLPTRPSFERRRQRYEDASETKSGLRDQSFTSNRRTVDQGPGVPEAGLARTRHHILCTGSVLVENCEADTVGDNTSGAPKDSESSICSVQVAAPVTSLHVVLEAPGFFADPEVDARIEPAIEHAGPGRNPGSPAARIISEKEVVLPGAPAFSHELGLRGALEPQRQRGLFALVDAEPSPGGTPRQEGAAPRHEPRRAAPLAPVLDEVGGERRQGRALLHGVVRRETGTGATQQQSQRGSAPQQASSGRESHCRPPSGVETSARRLEGFLSYGLERYRRDLGQRPKRRFEVRD